MSDKKYVMVPVELKELLASMVELHDSRGTVLTVHMQDVKEILAAAPQAPAAPDHWSFSNPGLADQYRAEAKMARSCLGFDPDAGDVSPSDIRDAIKAPAAPGVQGMVFFSSATGDHFPRIGNKYLVRIKGVLQEEIFDFDQSDDGNGGGEYFWGRDDIDDCPLFDWERDEWIPLSAIATHQKREGAE